MKLESITKAPATIRDKNNMKKASYIGLTVIMFVLGYGLIHMLFMTRQTITPAKATLTLQPHTTREKAALLKAKDESDNRRMIVDTPLIAANNPIEAQAHVLHVATPSTQASEPATTARF